MIWLRVLVFVWSILAARCDTDNTTTPEPPSFLDEQLKDLSSEDAAQLHEKSEKFTFQAEVTRLLDIIINSLYTHKAVFVRELISNAADALEKARILAMSSPKVLDGLPELEIRVQVNKDDQTISIRDTGIGMTKQDLINNLGTVARSGTSNFLEALAESGDINLIGQFGVGFYSAFLVADRVTVTSKHPDDPEQHIWESMIGGSYTIGKDPRGPTLIRGTQIVLHLKNDSSEFLTVHKLREKIENYNQFINYPIKIYIYDNPQNQTTTTSWQLVNSQKPIWLRPKEELNETDYYKFFEQMYYDRPIAYTHFSGEGEVEFKALLFLPSRPPRDRYETYLREEQDAIKLYSHRILVSEATKDILPRWLNFVRGIVDTEDLPLKVDRESYSSLKAMKVIKKKLVSKFLELLGKLSKTDREEWSEYTQKKNTSEAIPMPQTDFLKFWLGFGKHLKLACIEDMENKDKIAKYLRFMSNKLPPLEFTTLDEYIERMPETQKEIYYIIGDTYNQTTKSPHMKYYTDKGYEVLVSVEALDHSCFDRIGKYQDKPLVSIEKSTSATSVDIDKTRQNLVKKAFKPLTTAWKSALKSKVFDVQLSFKLVDVPAVISFSDPSASALNDRLMRAQIFYNPSQSEKLWKSRLLMINPNHPIMHKMLSLAKVDQNDTTLLHAANTLYDIGLLNGGYIIDDPSQLLKTYLKYYQKSLDIPEDETVKEYELSPEELEDPDEESPSVERTEEVDMDGDSAAKMPYDPSSDPEFEKKTLDEKLNILMDQLPPDVQDYHKAKLMYLNETEKEILLKETLHMQDETRKMFGGMKMPNVTSENNASSDKPKETGEDESEDDEDNYDDDEDIDFMKDEL